MCLTKKSTLCQADNTRSEPLLLCQVLKEAVGAALCQNEAEVKIHMEIDQHISSTEEEGKIRLTEQSDFPCLFCG